MKKQDTLKNDKQMYQKPHLNVIELSADEVLAVGCKSVAGFAPGGGPPCQIRNCAKKGS